jgi:hypothetical protein
MGAAGYAVWGSVVTMGLVVLAWAYKSRPGRRARLTLQRSIRVSIRRMMPRAGLVARH